MVQPAGVGDASPESVIAGVLDIVRTGEGPEASKAWAKGCALTGDCIAACDEAVNPRFLLAMARVALAKQSSELRNRRKQGVENFRLVADGVNVLARMQLGENDLARLGQYVNDRLENGSTAKPGERPDFVFYTGCNVLKTPHMALMALDIMDALERDLSCHGRPNALLRRHSAARGRHRRLRARRHEFARQARRREGRRHFLVCKLPCPIHRNDNPDRRKGEGRAAVRDDAVHAVS